MRIHGTGRNILVCCLVLLGVVGILTFLERAAPAQPQNPKQSRHYGREEAESLLRSRMLKGVRGDDGQIYNVVFSNSKTMVTGTNNNFLYWLITYGDTNTCNFNSQLKAKSFEAPGSMQTCTNGTSVIDWETLFIKPSDILP